MEISNLPRLEWLDLGYNELTGSIPTELGNLASIQSLFLRNNGLTGSIPSSLANLANLRLLYLNNNELTGPIPPELGNLARLETLSLGSNGLTGSIPPELGKLARLKRLVLSNNVLTGPIPPELRRLASLEYLVLGGNPDFCIPDDPSLQAWLVDKATGLFPCRRDDVQLLPRALMRADGNGLSLALPEDLRDPATVNVSDPGVVDAAVADGWLALAPLSIGHTDVELVPSRGGLPAVVGVVVREPVGTFGIDIVVDQPAPFGYEEGMITAADWWSSVLDGTEWLDQPVQCPNGLATALMDELMIWAGTDPDTRAAGYARTCLVRASQDLPTYRPSGGGVWVHPNSVSQGVLRHEIGHILGLVEWPSWTGLTTEDRKHFIGSRAVEAYRMGGGDPSLPGVPLQAGCMCHWRDHGDLMSPTSDAANGLSLAALDDAGYTVDMSKATPWRMPGYAGAPAARDDFRDFVIVEPQP